MGAATAPTRESDTEPDRALDLHERRRARARLRAWLPSVLMVLIVAATLIGAVAVNSSWWTADSPAASNDQLAADGTSTFTPAGRNFIDRVHWASIDLRDGRLSASALGLPSDGVTTLQPPVPIDLVLLGDDGQFVEYVDYVEISTEGDRVVAVMSRSAAKYGYRALIAHVEDRGSRYGWDAADIAELESRLVARASGSPAFYSGSTDVTSHLGLRLVAELAVDIVAGDVSLRWYASPLS